ncbi:MAG TPA: methyltransferase domain-containing protein [Steroidobacteraceae bacterium]|nr:methyltransferase domain-containing protein [Steroidobacteraceae bacterium]
MKAAEGVLADVSTCEDRTDRFAVLRRGIAPEPGPVRQAVRTSTGASPLELLATLLRYNSAFLEIAASDCSFALSMAHRVKRAFAVTSSGVITDARRFPANFHLVAAEGTCIPVPEASIDLAYSNGLVDQLDPKQASEQFANVYRSLARGGVFVCCARNRLLDAPGLEHNGPPHTLGELRAILRKAGFRTVVQYARCGKTNLRLPGAIASAIEWGMGVMSASQRERACNGTLRQLLDTCLIATK